MLDSTIQLKYWCEIRLSEIGIFPNINFSTALDLGKVLIKKNILFIEFSIMVRPPRLRKKTFADA